jgi:L-serine dehydratase
MQKDNPSIFNDVLGPVMCGPSSSHTAASGRIGLLVRYLVDDVCKATIRFPATSSYASTYKGQRSDIQHIRVSVRTLLLLPGFLVLILMTPIL